MQFAQIDPRPQSLQAQIDFFSKFNKIVFFEGTCKPLNKALEELKGNNFINIDPQHTGGDAEMSSILHCWQNALTMDLPNDENTIWATVRPDLDSVGAIALMKLFGEATPVNGNKVFQIHESDTLQTALKAKWKPHTVELHEPSELEVMQSMLSDFSLSMEEKVSRMECFLTDRVVVEWDKYYSKVVAERKAIDTALKDGGIKVSQHGNISFVKSEHRAATSIGYQTAPIIVACNPKFPDKNKGEVVKYTICQWGSGYVDLPAVWEELNQMEEGWGGSPLIGGSPQGVSSALTPTQVVRVVKKHLI